MSDVMIRVHVNDIYEEYETGRRFRILWISKDSELVFAYELDMESGFPFIVNLHELARQVEDDIIIFKQSETCRIKTEPASKEDLQKRDAIWEMVGEVLTNEPDVYDKKKRSQMLDQVTAKTGKFKSNLYRLLRRYWQEGKTKDCFLPRYVSSPKRKAGGKKLRGVKSDKSQRGIMITDADEKNFCDGIYTHYLKKNKITLEEAYTLMLEDHYSTPIYDANGELTGEKELLPEEMLPSFWQFRYWYRENIGARVRVERQNGKTDFDLNHNDELGRADYGVRGPGTCFQIDATVADVYVVSPYNRDDIIGRPVVYLVVDVFSRLIAGLYVGLEGPSWIGMMMALYNTFTDKVAYCEKYGIEITEEEWPCHYLPDVLLGDRGELFSDKATGIIESLGIQVDNTPPYMGLCKPFVERSFKTMDGTTTVFIPGRVRASTDKRGEKDYRLDATLTIQEITGIFIRSVLYHNNERVLETMEIPESLVIADADVDVNPRSIWNWGVQHCGGTLRQASEKEVRLALMPKESGSITKKGISFKKRLYSCKEFEDMDLFVTAKDKGCKKVTVTYDPRNVAAVYVWMDADEHSPYYCELLDWEDKYKGLTDEEFGFISKKWDMKKSAGKRADNQAYINLKKYIDETVENAQKEATGAVIPKRKRLEGINANKQEAKAEERDTEAFTSPKYQTSGSTTESGEKGSDTRQDDVSGESSPKKEEGRKMSPAMRKIFASIEKRNQEGGENKNDNG